eukprot:767495-Hanusia_phi.AAC.2
MAREDETRGRGCDGAGREEMRRRAEEEEKLTLKLGGRMPAPSIVDELQAISGNDGERINEGESGRQNQLAADPAIAVQGRETATEYARRIKNLVAEREALDRDEEEKALAKLSSLQLDKAEDIAEAAVLLCKSLKDGVIARGILLAREFLKRTCPFSGTYEFNEEEAEKCESRDFTEFKQHMKEFVGAEGEDQKLRTTAVMWIGAIFLNVFVASNWTGPPMKIHFSPLPCHSEIESSSQTAIKLNAASKHALEEDSADCTLCCKLAFYLSCDLLTPSRSEMFYDGAEKPIYLRAALALLFDVIPDSSSHPFSLPWWSARAVGIQQRLLHTDGREGAPHSMRSCSTCGGKLSTRLRAVQVQTKRMTGDGVGVGDDEVDGTIGNDRRDDDGCNDGNLGVRCNRSQQRTFEAATKS